MPSGLLIDCRLARDYTLENVPGAMAYLLIKVMSDPSLQYVSLPLNISLIIDVSRSMNGEKIRCAREAAKMLIESLRENDSVSVIVFSDDAKLVVPTTRASGKPLILAAIDEILTRSGTRLSLGMNKGLTEFQETGFEGKINQMFLLTDGQTDQEKECLEIADKARENHISITALGIGKRYNEQLLSQIADTTLGCFYHLKRPAEINEIFQKELKSTTDSILAQMSLSLDLEPGAVLTRIDKIFPNCIRLTVKGECESLTTEIGSLNKNAPVIIGAQLKLPALPAGNVKIARISVNYSIPDSTAKNETVSKDIFLKYTDNRSLCARVDRDVVGYFSQINAVGFVEQAILDTKRGNIDDAKRNYFEAQEITRKIENIPLALNIHEAVTKLSQSGTITEEGIKTIQAGSRFTVRVEKIN